LALPKAKPTKEPPEFHPFCDLFPRMTEDELAELTADIAAHRQHESIKLYQGKILDGRNRYEACKRAGKEPRYAVVDFPSEAAARAFVVSCNPHRRHLTAEQKSELALKLVKDNPERSDRSIAAEIKVSPTTVGKARAQLSTVDSSFESAKRTGRDGKTRRTPIPTSSPAVTYVPPRPTSGGSNVETLDALSTRIACRNPKSAAATIIRHMARDDIRELVTALQAFLDSPVLQ
jgi:hypothetical protein